MATKVKERIYTLTTPSDRSYVIVVAEEEQDMYECSVTEVTDGAFEVWDGLGKLYEPDPLRALDYAIGSIWSHEEENEDG